MARSAFVDLSPDRDLSPPPDGGGSDGIRSPAFVAAIPRPGCAARGGVAEPGTPRAASDFVLTFDDGYADLFEVAFPLLVRDNLPFVLYLATSHVESGEPMSPGATPLTWDEIGTMNESGLMSLGAHTHQHLDLRRASLHKVEEDLGLSDELISRRVGVNPRHFAYPWGYWSPIADTVVRSRYDSAALGVGHPSPPTRIPTCCIACRCSAATACSFSNAKQSGGCDLKSQPGAG